MRTREQVELEAKVFTDFQSNRINAGTRIIIELLLDIRDLLVVSNEHEQKKFEGRPNFTPAPRDVA